jgi:Ser/Thr protein kinase RdoA (MazF antagonist)
MGPRCVTLPGMEEEHSLVGGLNPDAGIVRIGDTVRRPAGSSSAAVRALLQHLETVGFDGAPRFLDVDEQGRDVLTFLDGDVPLPPYPGWALTDDALDDLGQLLRRFHEATADFDGSSVAGWSHEWSDPGGGPVICHNDVFPENVVFRDGHVVALIDFAMAAPGRPLWDLAIAAQEWAPLHAPASRVAHPDELDGVRRTGRLARAYGVEPQQAEELLDVIAEERAHSLAHVREQAAAGNSPWQDWNDLDEQRAAADGAWLEHQRPALLAAVRAAAGARPAR